MKNSIFKITTFLGIMTLIMIMVPSARAMTLYDDFSSGLLDETKWIWLEYVRETEGGKFVSMARRTNSMDPCIYTTGTPNSIEAEVMLKAVEGPDSGTIRARIGEYIYNDGTGTGSGDYTGDVWAELGIGLYRGVLEARWYVFKMLNPDRSDSVLMAEGSLGPVSKDVLFHLSMTWNPGSGTITFSIDGTTESFLVSDSIHNPSNPWWGIGSRLSLPVSQLAMVEGVFDNVKKDGILYDDFEGAELDSSKWSQLDLARVIRDGKCYLRNRTWPGETRNMSMGFVQPDGIRKIQTKATLRKLVPSGNWVRLRIVGAFYSDGPDSDIWPAILIGDDGEGSGQPKAWCYVMRKNRDLSEEIIEIYEFGLISMNEQYALSLSYDGTHNFVFKINGETHSIQGPPKVGPPLDFTGIGKRICLRINGGATQGEIVAEIDDVMITSDQLKPDIRANGSDGPITVTPNDSVGITISLDPGNRDGDTADWWVAVKTPFAPPGDWYTFVYPGLNWLPGVNLCAQTGLFDLAPYEVLNRTLPVGTYTFYFAVDPPDGQVTAELMNSVEVIVQ